MRCPTCGKPVRKNQDVCSYCGAMTASPSAQAKTGSQGMPVFQELAHAPAEQPETTWRPRPAPERRELGPFDLEEEVEPPEPMPGGQERPQGRPNVPPPWTKWVSPIFFLIMFFVLQFWLRDSRAPSDAPARPTLTEAGFAESFADGAPGGRKREFSLQEDREVVFFAIWRGEPEGLAYSVRWLEPSGTPRAVSEAQEAPRAPAEEFATYAVLTLTPDMPTGAWQVELLQGDRLAARQTFRLRP